MSDGKISVREVAEDFIGSCTNAIDNVATDMGLPTPSSLYTALMPGGTGVISKDFANPIIFMCWDNIKRHLNVFFVSKIWENRKFCLILRMIRGLCYSL